MQELTSNYPVSNRQNVRQRRVRKLALSLATFMVIMALIIAAPNAHSGGCESTSGDCSVSIGQLLIV